jgi:hypothetical protein
LLRECHRFGIAGSCRQQTCESEVQHLHVAIVTHHDVVRLDVAVSDACCVGGAQGTRHLRTKREERLDGIVVCDDSTQRTTSNKLHDDEAAGFTLTDVVYCNYVWMIERRRSFRFQSKAAHSFRVFGEFSWQKF